MSEHSTLPIGERHAVHNWEYADAAARAAATGFVTADLKKLALQLDDSSLWMLTATTPTWQQVSTNSSSSGSGNSQDALALAASINARVNQGSGVTAGSYTNPSITIDEFGRVTAASNGSAGADVLQVQVFS